MNIVIRYLPKRKMRYDTEGDWYEKQGILFIEILKDLNEKERFLCAMHELTEWWWCKNNGVSQKQVDDYDMNYKRGDNPGADRKAPYHKGHQWGLKIEKVLSKI